MSLRAFLLAAALLAAAATCSAKLPPHRVLDAVFLPYYPMDNITQEVELIQVVITAKMSDKKTYSSRDNPYRIRYNCYNVEMEGVIQGLIAAREIGVYVQVLVDAMQMQPDHTWNTGLLELVQAGFSYSPTQTNLTQEQLYETQLIGIVTNEDTDIGALMHLKTRIFNWLDVELDGTVTARRHVYSGSFNPEDTFTANETILSVSIPEVIDRYEDKYLATLYSSYVENRWVDDSPVNVLFGPNDKGVLPVDKIFEYINSEKELIFITVFTFLQVYDRYGNSLSDALIAAHKRGVAVITASDANMENVPFITTLADAGIANYLCNNTSGEFIAMHNKNAVYGVTDVQISTDTSNWSDYGLGYPPLNAESVMFINATVFPDLGKKFLSNALYLLRSYEFQQAEGYRTYRDIMYTLQNIKGWMQTTVNFEVQITGAQAGDLYSVSGNCTQLGNSTDLNNGAPLAWDSSLKCDPPAQGCQVYTGKAQLPFGLNVAVNVVRKRGSAVAFLNDADYVFAADGVIPDLPGGSVEGMTLTVSL